MKDSKEEAERFRELNGVTIEECARMIARDYVRVHRQREEDYRRTGSWWVV